MAFPEFAFYSRVAEQGEAMMQGPKAISELQPNGECWCGCGGLTTSARAFFIPSHDRIAEAALIKLEYGSIVNMLAKHGFGPGGRNLSDERARLTRR
jgi:hypothetical protein